MRAELGAMHYTSNQILLRSLVENKLHLKTYDFPGSYPENILYLRGYHLREQDLSNPEKVPYNMQWHEKRKSASELVASAIEQILPRACAIPASAWHEVKQTACFDGVKLYKQGFSNVLNRVMSNEAYEFIRYAGGCDTILSKWYSSQAATERVQKLRVEYWVSIKHIEPENLVFLEETGILRSFDQNSCPFATGDKTILIKTILSSRKNYSYRRN